MDVLAIVGSPRRQGNTHLLTQKVLDFLESNGWTTRLIFLSDYAFVDCDGCQGCLKTTTCVKQDEMQKIYPLIDEAKALILSSPTYYYNVTADMKKLIDRFFCYNIFDPEDRTQWTSYNHIHGKKVGATITVCEQKTKADIGFTTQAMRRPLEDIGYDVVYSLEAIRSFAKGDVLSNKEAMNDAQACGIALIKALRESR